jgi:CheY-like chemotaxis protein
MVPLKMSEKKKKILLLVEDNAVLASMYKAAFEREGSIEVIFAYDGDSAIRLAADAVNKPDLMLLDILMPGIDGMTVLKTLRDLPETKDLKIVILTVLANPEVKDQAMRLGALDYVVKSDLKLSDIVEKIKGYIST